MRSRSKKAWLQPLEINVFLDYDQTLVDKFQVLLDSNENIGKKREQEVQDFLEEHTELIPTISEVSAQVHMNSIISKFPLARGMITDYVFLTRNSGRWEITLVELEVPEKPIYLADVDRPSFSSDFTRAEAQVRQWKRYVENNRTQVIEALRPIMKPDMDPPNPVEFRYQLIIGRSDTKNLTTERKEDFNKHQRESGIQVMTYDRVINIYRDGIRSKRNVMRASKNRFAFKSLLPNPYHIFSVLSPTVLKLTTEQIADLEKDGHHMDAWKRGELLIVNNKKPISAVQTVLKVGGSLKSLTPAFEKQNGKPDQTDP
nr:Shedu anti-phage system protein SduA domain-containing protein [Rhizobium laguerreae]